MSDYQEYPEVVQEVRGALNPGRLKLQSNSVVFRNIKTGKIDQFQGSEVEKAQWLKRAKGHCLKIVLENGQIHRFDGFKDTDYDKLASFVSTNYGTKLEKVDLSVKGWNWGVARFEGNGLNFAVENNLAFEIPLTNVSHATKAKNEVTLEFHQNDDAAVSLIELRFHIPGPSASDQTNADNDPVQDFHDAVIKNADIIQATGDAVCVFPEVQCLTPRGRYDIKIYTTFLQLHGKTFDYKIPYTTVLRLFLLPHKDGRQIFFVVSLDPPIKQGQTRYHFLILLFYKDDEMTLEIGLSEEEIQEKYEGKLQPEMTGLEYEVISKVFKAVTTRKITVPGNFIGHSGTPAISCSYKAATGLLYPLERGFIFVHKPPIHIRFDELAAVNFARSAGSTRTFDFDVETKAGNVCTFSSIEKDEYSKLFDFVKKKNLRMKNIGLKGATTNYEEMMDSDNEDTHDAYLERMKAEGKDRDSDDMDDDSDSSDEDFNPGESGSDVAEEYDSNPPTSSDSDSDFDPSGGGGSDDDASGSEAERRKEEKRLKKEKRAEEKKAKKSKSAKTVREGSTKKKKKSKKDTDPDKPKRPQTAYFLWYMEHREEIKNKHPGASVTELAKKAGETWKEMSAEDKKEYEDKFKEAKEEYNRAMEEYNRKQAEEGRGDRDSSSPKEKKKKKSSPKKVVSETRAGAGGDYKSKEFITSSSSSGSESEDTDDKPLKSIKKEASEEEMEVDKGGSSSEDKPLKPKVEQKKRKKKEAKKEIKKEKKEESSSEEEDSKPLKTRSKRAKDGDSSDAGSLPDELDEEILSSPEHSGHSAASGSDSE